MHWPGQSAIGRRVRLAPDGPVMEVVGVAGDIQYFSIGEAPKPFFFRPYGQWYRSQMTINVLGSATPAQLTLVRDAVSGLDPNLPVFDVRSMRDHILNGRAL